MLALCYHDFPARRNNSEDGMSQIEFKLTSEFVKLDDLLKLTGMCDSGGAAKALVAAGGVSVDGAVELRKTCKIRAGQVVGLGDSRIAVVAQR